MKKFYSREDVTKLRFYQVPKVLLEKDKYRDLGLAEKMVYGVLLDRTMLSIKNDWFDENDFAYILFSGETLGDALNVHEKTARRYINNLKKFGLLEEKRMGRGMANRIYLVQPDYIESDTYSKEQSYPQAETIENNKKEQNVPSRRNKMLPLEGTKCSPIDTDSSDTDFNDTHSFIQDNEGKNNNKNKESNKKETIERMNEDKEKLNSILNDLDLNDFKDRQVNDLAIKKAIEILWYKKSIQNHGITVYNKQIRNDLKLLTYNHLVNASNIFIKESERQEIKNRIGYLAMCIYNSIFDIDMSIHNQIYNS